MQSLVVDGHAQSKRVVFWRSLPTSFALAWMDDYWTPSAQDQTEAASRNTRATSLREMERAKELRESREKGERERRDKGERKEGEIEDKENQEREGDRERWENRI